MLPLNENPTHPYKYQSNVHDFYRPRYKTFLQRQDTLETGLSISNHTNHHTSFIVTAAAAPLDKSDTAA